MVKRISLMASLTVILSACGGGSSTNSQSASVPTGTLYPTGVSPQGLCDQGYVGSYNDLVTGMKKTSAYVGPDGKFTDYAQGHMDEVIQSLRDVKSKCDAFQRYRETACTATDTSTGLPIHVDPDRMKTACDSVKDSLDQYDHGGTPTPKPDTNFQASFPTAAGEITSAL